MFILEFPFSVGISHGSRRGFRSWVIETTWPPTRNCASCGQKLLELWCSSLSPAICDVACLQLDPISHFSFSILQTQKLNQFLFSLSLYFRFVESLARNYSRFRLFTAFLGSRCYLLVKMPKAEHCRGSPRQSRN